MKDLQKLIDEKYISVQKHPTEDLYIYNYTQKAQFNRVWNSTTMACRGLIMNGKGDIIARPFPKFFNYGEYTGEIPNESFEVTEKMDGSLGIMYWIGETPYIATRGSFVSEQAIEGTKMIQEIHKLHPYLLLKNGWTYLWEIIYPENRIVVDYKGMRGLVLLSVVETVTGEEVNHHVFSKFEGIINIVKRHNDIVDISKLSALQEPNREGFVIHYNKSGLRLKVKFDEYVRLHRLVTGMNARHIWENLKEGKGIEELIDHVPDEFYSWVKTTAKNLQDEYDLVESLALKHWEVVKTLPDRKSQAMALMGIEEKQKCVIPIVFNLLDGKSYADRIWKIIKPAHEVPFKKEI